MEGVNTLFSIYVKPYLFLYTGKVMIFNILKSFRNNTIFNIQIGPLVSISSCLHKANYMGQRMGFKDCVVPILLPCYLI